MVGGHYVKVGLVVIGHGHSCLKEWKKKQKKGTPIEVKILFKVTAKHGLHEIFDSPPNANSGVFQKLFGFQLLFFVEGRLEPEIYIQPTFKFHMYQDAGTFLKM
jgi:hypothetical protein